MSEQQQKRTAWHAFRHALLRLTILVGLVFGAIPAFAGWDWSDGKAYSNASFDENTFVLTWRTLCYNDDGMDECFADWVTISVKLPLGDANWTDWIAIARCKEPKPGNYTGEVTAEGKKLGVESLGHQNDGEDCYGKFKWKIPVKYLNKEIKWQFKGKWVETYDTDDTMDVNVERSYSYKADPKLSTPAIKTDEVKFIVDPACKKGWRLDLPYYMTPPGSTGFPCSGDIYSVVYPRVSCGDGKYYSYPVNSYANKDKNDSTRTYTLRPEDLVGGKATVPDILRNGGDFVLFNSLFGDDEAKKDANNALRSMPNPPIPQYSIEPMPYPQRLFCTFLSKESHISLRWEGLGSKDKNKGAEGSWRIYRNGEFIAKTGTADDQETYFYVDTFQNVDSLAREEIFAKGVVEYIVAWMPKGVYYAKDITKIDNVPDSVYLKELSATKSVKTEQYVQIINPEVTPYDDRLVFTWDAVSSNPKWNGMFTIKVDGERTLATVKPIQDGGKSYRFEHLSGAVEIPSGGYPYPYKQDNDLYACNPHDYTISTYVSTTDNVLVEANFKDQSVGNGMVFRNVTVSQGVFAEKVRVAATASRIGDQDIFFRVERVLYEDAFKPGTEWTTVFTQENGATSLSWDDINVVPGNYYMYRVIAFYECGEINGKMVTPSIVSQQVGFCQNTGIVSGQITYNGGTAARDIDLELSDVDEGASRQRCYEFTAATDSIYWRMPTQNYASRIEKGDHTIQFWMKPTVPALTSTTPLFTFGSTKVALAADGLYVGGEKAISDINYKNHFYNTWHHVTLAYHDGGYDVQVYTAYLDSGRVKESIVRSGRCDADFKLVKGDLFAFSGTAGYYDDIRLWRRTLSDIELEHSHDRYLCGEEEGLELYWTLDEGLFADCFDTSRTNGQLNGHNGRIIGATSSNDGFEDLRFRATTDIGGNYVLRGIPFDGEGVNYRLVPSRERHTFAPEARTRFVSANSLVHNATDFTDVSSFPFYGKINYLYGNIPVDSVDVLVDGKSQSDGREVLRSDRFGRFKLNVPIGSHRITLQRDGHVFGYSGQWPIDGTEYKFEDAVGSEADPILFTDSTLVTVAGRVCGGDLMAALPLCVERSGSYANIGQGHIVLALSSSQGYQINTGFEDIHVGGSVCDAILRAGSDEVIIDTNPATGEYMAMVPPVGFRVKSVSTKDFVSENLREDFGDLNLRSFTPLPTSELKATVMGQMGVTDANASADAKPDAEAEEEDAFTYNHELTFVRHNDPKYLIMDPDNAESIVDSCENYNCFLGDTVAIVKKNRLILLHKDRSIYDTPDLLACNDPALYPLGYPVFTKDQGYNFLIAGYEQYVNRDDESEPIYNTVPLVGHTLNVHNPMNAVTLDTETLVLDSLGTATYSWGCGAPNLTSPYRHNFNFVDATNGKEFGFSAYVFGGQPIDGSSFITQGPQDIDFVIHDPYGTNSSAWLEEGSCYTKNVYNRALSDMFYLKQTVWAGVQSGWGKSVTFSQTKAERLEEFYRVEADPYENVPDVDDDGPHRAPIRKSARRIPESQYNGDAAIGVVAGAAGIGGIVAGLVGIKTIKAAGELKFEFQVMIGEDTSYSEHWYDTNTTNTVITQTSRISTSDSPSNVGAEADVFVGESSNYQFGETNYFGLWPKDPDATPTSLNDFEFGVQKAITFALDPIPTRFRYTRSHIERELLPELRSLRRALFDPNREPQGREGRYVLRDGYTLEDLETLPADKMSEAYDWIVTDVNPDSTKVNLCDIYTASIDNWIRALRTDELLQSTISNDRLAESVNYSISTGASRSVSKAIKAKYANGITKDTNQMVALYVGGEGRVGMAKIDANVVIANGVDTGNKDDNYEDEESDSKKMIWGYNLREDTRANYVSQDVYYVPDTLNFDKALMHGNDSIPAVLTGCPVFILRAGQTQSPWEKALRMHYVDLKDRNNPENIVGSDTQPLAVPDLSFPQSPTPKAIELTHQRAGHDVIVDLKIQSNSPQTLAGIDYVLTAQANNDVTGLELLVDGATIVGRDREYRLKAGEPIVTPLVIRQVRKDKYDYDVWLDLFAAGQMDKTSPLGFISDSVRLVVHFDPTSSDVTLTPGASVVNQQSDGKVQLRISDYDLNLENFSCIDLMYRTLAEGDYKHTLARYWVNAEQQQNYAAAIKKYGYMPFTTEHLITTPAMVHDFNMESLPDGDYQVIAVARSYYPNGAGGSTQAFETEVRSEEFSLRKDMVSPVALGKPAPLDGVINIGDMASITFNEDINVDVIDPDLCIKAEVKINDNDNDDDDWKSINYDWSADARHIYIDITRVMKEVNRRDVRFTLTGIRDVAGNVLAEPIVWTAFVELAPLHWSSENVEIVTELGKEGHAQVTLVNTTKEPFSAWFGLTPTELGILPTWLKMTRLFVDVPAETSVPVDITISPDAPMGRHDFSFYATPYKEEEMTEESLALLTLVQPLNVHVNVIGQAPDWNVRPADYDYSTNMVGVITVPEGQFLYPDNDKLFALVGDECVGVARIPAPNVGELRYTMMDIYTNNPYTGQPITLYAWDSATGTLYADLPTSQPLKVTPAAMIGSYDAPVIITVKDKRRQPLDMEEGWNWVSFNVIPEGEVVEDIIRSLAKHGEVLIKTQELSFWLQPDGTVLRPSEEDLAEKTPTADMMYAIQSPSTANFGVIGTPVDLSAGIPLAPAKEGEPSWTWIAYHPQYHGTINEVLDTSHAVEGDIIKSQQEFAVFHHNTSTDTRMWVGSLQTLWPGRGYKYLSHATEAQTLHYNAPEFSLTSLSAARAPQRASYYHADCHYADNMTVLAAFEDQDAEHIGEVAAFVGDECRGSAHVREDGLVFLTIQGRQQGEQISLRYYNADTGEEQALEPTISYGNDAILGTVAEPLLLHFAAEDIVGVTTGEGDAEYYSIDGRRIGSERLQQGGVYIRRTTQQGGVRSTEKIIKH